MKTPHAKKPVVTCWSHSHGAPIARVTTSHSTASVNIAMHTPHRTIRHASSTSNAGHFRWRCRCRTRARGSAMARALLHVADQLEQLDGMRAELGRELVLDRLRRLDEAG